MTKGQIAGTVIGVLAAVALGICLCTYFQRLKEKNETEMGEELYGGPDGDGQPDDEEFAAEHPEAKKSATANPMHAVATQDDEDEYEEVEVSEDEEEEEDEDDVVPAPATGSKTHDEEYDGGL
jgi:hypothetical protein